MPGIFISNVIEKHLLNDKFNNKCIHESIENANFCIQRNTLKKFIDDKLFFSDNEHIIIIEGFVLNKKELVNMTKQKDFISAIKYLINVKEKLFFSKFRGSFSGAWYDKKQDEWIIYTNHVGDKPIFYYYENNIFIAGSSINYITDALKKHNIRYTLNNEAVYDLLTYGFMASGQRTGTLINEIKRLSPGHFIKYTKGKLEILEYYKFTNTNVLDDSIGEEEIIELIDAGFQRSIRLEYEKDLEYGYNHITSLSGGLDSRMNTWVANTLNYDKIINLTFCQSNYLDEIIAKQISNYLNTELLIKTLDDAKFLTDLEEIVNMNYGLSIYSGIAHGKSMFDYLNFENVGLLHTGQLGDSVIGTFCQDPIHYPVSKTIGLYSSILQNKINVNNLNYENEEMYFLYTRGFNGALCSHIAHSNYTEIVSPFLDVEFLQFCLNIPLKYRVNHYIYKKWILKKYPNAAKFKWEKMDGKITENKLSLFAKKLLKKGPRRFLKLINYNLKASNKSMNPFDYWYDNNVIIKEFMDDYYTTNYRNQNLNDELINDIKLVYETGNANEKTQVLTALAAIKIYFGK